MCKGFGHITPKCAKILKKIRSKKAINIPWSEDEDNDAELNSNKEDKT